MDSQQVLNNLSKKISENPQQLILLVIKGRYPFATNLNGLDLSDCISVLLLNCFYATKIPRDHLQHFDFVQNFEAGEFWTGSGNMLSHLDELEFPRLDECIEKIITTLRANPDFDIERLRLVAMEEQFVRIVAKIRQRYEIVGAKPTDVDRFTDKTKMKEWANRGGLPFTKYFIVKPSDLKKNSNEKMKLENELGYPLLFKPVHGVGASGITKIDNPSELENWINENSQPDTAYLAEEYIEGQEIHSIILIQSKTFQIFPTIFTPYGSSIFTSIRDQIPLVCVVERDPQKIAIIEKFVQKTMKIFQPHDGGIAFVQAFLTKNGRMKLSEIAYRVPGMIGSIMMMENSGVSPESVLIMAQLRPLNLRKLIDNGRKRKKYFATFVYPKKEGVIKNILQLDPTKLKSEIEILNTIEIGERTKAATNVGDMSVRLFLWNDNGETLENDCVWLRENFHPIVMED